MNYKMIFHVLSMIILFEGIFMALPAATALLYGESAFWSFLAVGVFCVLFGLVIILKNKKAEKNRLYAREGFVIVALSWIVISVFGALPFFLSGAIPSFVDALFESVSGFTTTGASILSDVEAMPKSCLMWRSFSHWVGGMGVLMFIMIFLPLSGGQNINMMKAESTGPVVSKLTAKVQNTAIILYGIYFALTLIQFILLLFGGMSWFEALNTAFATAGTGGFGVKNSSLGGYSPYIQIVVTVFMLLFSVNFSCYFLALKGKIKDALNTELRVFVLIVAVVTAVITINILSMYGSVQEALRHSAFTVASIISTTGFSTEDFNLWPELSRSLLVLIMFIGAMAGSTGGGIKVSRLIILSRSLAREMGQMIHPRQVKKVKIDRQVIDEDVIGNVNVYMISFVLLFTISILLISFDNHDLVTNFTAVAAAINNIGPGLELVGPTSNFSFFSDPAKLVLIFDMLAGRLELFPMILLFSPTTWKK